MSRRCGRRACARRGDRQGESIKFISRQVGHSSAKLTLDIYSHLMEGTEVEAMGRLEERLEFVEIAAKP